MDSNGMTDPTVTKELAEFYFQLQASLTHLPKNHEGAFARWLTTYQVWGAWGALWVQETKRSYWYYDQQC